jgi:hypothetical protein
VLTSYCGTRAGIPRRRPSLLQGVGGLRAKLSANCLLLPLKPVLKVTWAAAARQGDLSKLPLTHVQHPVRVTGVKVTSLYSKILGGSFDIQRQVRDDLAHHIRNLIRDMLNLLSGAGNMKLTTKRRENEIYIGRSLSSMLKSTKLPPWQASPADIASANTAMSNLRLSSGMTLRHPFRSGKKYLISEAFLLCGPLGHYLIELLSSVSVPCRTVYHGLVNVCSKLLLKSFRLENAPLFLREALAVFASSEIRFPMYFHQITHHGISHAWGPGGDAHARIAV